MDPHVHRDLEILTAIGEGRPITQRDLSQRLGVALGLTNLYVKRLTRQGLIKIREFPRKPGPGERLRYVLTPKGFAEKTRLSYAYMMHSLDLYRRARQALRESLSRLPDDGMKRIALYGTGEAAELAYLTLREMGLEPVGVFTRQAGGQFLGFPVRPVAELAQEDADAVILASFDPSEQQVAELAGLGLPKSKLLPLFPPWPSPDNQAPTRTE
jgi:DNA-binding MarR family transcriptional regulator